MFKFLRSVLTHLVPLEIWGSRDNQQTFFRHLEKFVDLRRWETVSVEMLAQGMKVSSKVHGYSQSSLDPMPSDFILGGRTDLLGVGSVSTLSTSTLCSGTSELWSSELLNCSVNSKLLLNSSYLSETSQPASVFEKPAMPFGMHGLRLS